MMKVHVALRVFAILLLAIGSQSCSATKIVLAHPDRGLEASLAVPDGSGTRSIKLQYDRARVTEQSTDHSPVCYACDDENGPGATFNLQFFAVNDTSSQWVIESDMVHLIPLGADSASVHRDHGGESTVIASIAPRATARIPIAFTVRGVDSDNEESQLYGEYKLLVLESSTRQPQSGAGGNRVMLERELSVDTFDQGKQATRVVVFFAVSLFVIGLL